MNPRGISKRNTCNTVATRIAKEQPKYKVNLNISIQHKSKNVNLKVCRVFQYKLGWCRKSTRSLEEVITLYLGTSTRKYKTATKNNKRDSTQVGTNVDENEKGNITKDSKRRE